MRGIAHHRPRIAGPTESGKHERILYGEILPPDDGLPVVICNDRQLADITTEVLGHLRAQDKGRSIFLRGGKPVQVCVDERDRVVIHEFTPASMRGRVARVAQFFNQCRIDKGKIPSEIGVVSVFPPNGMIQDLLALLPKQLGFRALEGITETPVLRPDGSVLLDPGYDADTALFYAP
jgi:hypothetical protein